jgi:hypothetical protein
VYIDIHYSQAIIRISRLEGAYAPLTMAKINAAKKLMRQERQKEKLDGQLPEVQEVGLAPTELTQSMPLVATVVKADSLSDNVKPVTLVLTCFLTCFF